MATTRLRKTFHYPADDSDDDDMPRDLDEEEQEKLIRRLRAENEERNDEYTRIFLAIPLTACLAYLPALLTSGSISAKFLSLLAITSLLASAYIHLYTPLPAPKQRDTKGKQPMRDLDPEPVAGPLNRYIGVLNVALSLLVCLNGIAFRNRAGVHGGFWLLGFVPGFVLATLAVARRVMLSVDVNELQSLRYEYKGA